MPAGTTAQAQESVRSTVAPELVRVRGSGAASANKTVQPGCREKCSTERGDRFFDGLEQGWNLGVDHIPENVFVDAKIAMG